VTHNDGSGLLDGDSLADKNAAMASLGAELVVHGQDFQESVEHARPLAGLPAEKEQAAGKRVAVIHAGGNCDFSILDRVMKEFP
jgi:threonine dehydratase